MTRAFLLFLDLNETLVRTGQVAPELRLEEARELTRFVDLCRELARRFGTLHLVLMTGNSFEYSRRIEEPLGLKNLDRVEVSIVSENGLIARSFQRGDLWRFDVTPAYSDAVAGFLEVARGRPELESAFYTQGNEVRTTLKPVENAFSTERVALLRQLAKTHLGEGLARVYAHPYYFDIDPVEVRTERGIAPFGGKHEATLRLGNELPGGRIVAIGDSSSDVPMFRAVLSMSGSAFWVANAGDREPLPGVTTATREFTSGVNEVLETVLAGPA